MNMRGCKRIASAAVLGAWVLLGGCARYQYVLVEPAEHRQTISKDGSVVSIAPLEYHFSDRKAHLAMRVMNPSASPVRLVGEKSYLVDPTGATRPLPGSSIAPNAHIGMFFPPAPIVYRSSPRFTFGVGFGHFYGPSWGPYHHFNTGWAYDPWSYDPWYYGPTDFYAINAPHHWEWETGEVRLRLVYDDNGTNVEHNFTFDRQRVK